MIILSLEIKKNKNLCQSLALNYKKKKSLERLGLRQVALKHHISSKLLVFFPS